MTTHFAWTNGMSYLMSDSYLPVLLMSMTFDTAPVLNADTKALTVTPSNHYLLAGNNGNVRT